MRAYVPCSPARDANVPREAARLSPRSGQPPRSILCGALPRPASSRHVRQVREVSHTESRRTPRSQRPRRGTSSLSSLTSHLFPPPRPSRFARIVASTAPFAAGNPLPEGDGRWGGAIPMQRHEWTQLFISCREFY